MSTRAVISAVVLLGSTGWGLAEPRPSPRASIIPAQTPGLGLRAGEPLPAQPECTCRGIGRDYTVGQQVCLNAPAGPRLATCDRYENNTSWIFSDTPCVYSAAPWPGRL